MNIVISVDWYAYRSVGDKFDEGNNESSDRDDDVAVGIVDDEGVE